MYIDDVRGGVAMGRYGMMVLLYLAWMLYSSQKILSRLRELLQPAGDTQFMRLTRELYSLEIGSGTPSQLLTRIKLLKEQIDATKTELTADKRILLSLTMALATDERYRSLVQIWQSPPDVTAKRARQMSLKKNRKVQLTRMSNNNGGDGSNTGETCATYSKRGRIPDEYWEEHPEFAPE